MLHTVQASQLKIKLKLLLENELFSNLTQVVHRIDEETVNCRSYLKLLNTKSTRTAWKATDLVYNAINSLTTRSALVKNCENIEKQTPATQESYGWPLSFEWQHSRHLPISVSKDITILSRIINNTTGKKWSVAFIWMVTIWDSIHRLKS